MKTIEDPIENLIADALYKKGIKYVHEMDDPNLKLDFYLPDFDVYIEAKHSHTDRINAQMASQRNIILIQGLSSAKLFNTLLNNLSDPQ